MKYPNLVLKRGVTYEDALLKWLWKTQREAQRIAVTVSLDGPGRPARALVVVRRRLPDQVDRART